MNKSETIAYVKNKLADPMYYEYALLVNILIDHVSLEDTALREFAGLLGTETYGCAKNDVVGLIDLMEEKDVEL